MYMEALAATAYVQACMHSRGRRRHGDVAIVVVVVVVAGGHRESARGSTFDSSNAFKRMFLTVDVNLRI